jgi:hypothetical protein
VAELHQTFKAHKGQLIEVKKHMPNVIKSIGGYIGYFKSIV